MTEKTPELNEVAAAAREMKQAAERADAAHKAERPQRWPLVPIGIGVGIGSAALAAALLYTNSGNKKK